MVIVAMSFQFPGAGAAGERTSGSLDAEPAPACPSRLHPRPLPLAADRLGHPRGADVGRIGEDFRQIEPAFLALEVADREAADMDRHRGVEPVPDLHGAAVERQRGVLQLEGGARLVAGRSCRG
jgi:hypothetical protein